MDALDSLLDIAKELGVRSAALKELHARLPDAHKQQARASFDELEVRCEAYDDAIAMFAEALKLANPVAAAMSRAAAAL